jgi:acetate kinase
MKELSVKPTAARILTINGGSSSVKFALFGADVTWSAEFWRAGFPRRVAV